jgi:hypothetical protein
MSHELNSEVVVVASHGVQSASPGTQDITWLAAVSGAALQTSPTDFTLPAGDWLVTTYLVSEDPANAWSAQWTDLVGVPVGTMHKPYSYVFNGSASDWHEHYFKQLVSGPIAIKLQVTAVSGKTMADLSSVRIEEVQ